MGLGSNQVATPELHQLQVTQSVNGICIPILYGTNRLPQLLLWYGDFVSGAPYQAGGKGLGKNGSSYEYYAAILGLLCNTPLSGIGNIWSQNGNLTLSTVTESYAVPTGGGSFTVSNQERFAYDLGVGSYAPYSVVANNYGAPAPVTLTGMQATAQQSASGTPGTGQYSSPSPGLYVFPPASAGQTMLVTYTYSLYTLSETEDDSVPNTGPYQVTVQYQTQFVADGGVRNTFTGQPLIRVPSGPSSGQYSVSGGNYFFSAADAGMSVAITYSWQQSNSNIAPGSTLNFTLIGGAPGQLPWSYLSSFHPSQAFGYSACALMGTQKMDLGEAAQLPNYNMECSGPFQFGAGIVDADVADCIADLLYSPFYGAAFQGSIDASLATIARDYWNSNSFFISPVLNSARPCADIIQEWCEAGNTGVFWSEGLLKFIPYGDTTTVDNGYVFTPQTAPVVDLNDDDFIADANEDPVQIDRTPWQDSSNQVKVQFTNRLNNYNPGVVTEQDDYATAQFGLRPEGQKDYGFLCTQLAATFSANTRLKRLVYIRRTFTFRISGLRYCFLEPMDLVTVTDIPLGLNKEPVRITRISEDENRIYTVTAEEFPWGTATATLYPKQPTLPPPPPPSLADPGDTQVVSIFQPSARVAASVSNSANQLWCALTGGPNWGGCNVFFSYDNQSYQPIGPQYGPTRAGYLTANLPAAGSPDTTNTLSVQISGQLFNVSLGQANAFATLCLLGTEYLGYQNADFTGSSNNGRINNYNLTYLLRGAFSSPVVAHNVSDPTQNIFIRLDDQVFRYSYDPSLAGSTVWFKFQSFNLLQNQVQDLANVTAYPFTFPLSATAMNMTIDSVLDVGGASASIRIYKAGTSPGTAGTASLNNGTVVTLPADTQTGEALSTLYYVNYNISGTAYVFYTDQNAWLHDQAVNNYLGIGSVMTVAGGGGFYLPSSYNDSSDAGNAAVNPGALLPGGFGDLVVNAYANQPGSVPAFASGGITYQGFLNGTPAVTQIAADVSLSVTGDGNFAGIDVSFDNGATSTPLFSASSATGGTYTLPVPPGTNLSNIIVIMNVPSPSSSDYSTTQLQVSGLVVS
jgi:hypothetical protein